MRLNMTFILFIGARDRTWTGTVFLLTDFKSVASAIPPLGRLEVPPGFEPGVRALQAHALPLGYGTTRTNAYLIYQKTYKFATYFYLILFSIWLRLYKPK